MEKLSRTTETSGHEPVSPRLVEHLTLIAKYALGCSKFGVCEIYLRRGESVFSLEAGYGHPEGGLQRGKELVVAGGHSSHLLRNDEARVDKSPAPGAGAPPAARPDAFGGEVSALTYDDDGLLLVLPVVSKDGPEGELLGLICIRDDSVDGARGRVGLTAESEAALRPFADAVACAVESSDRESHAEQLIAGAPVGVISIDGEKRITAFNRLAQELFKYEVEDVLGEPVEMLCDNPADPERIVELLQAAPAGKPVDYETFVRSGEGERIPVRLEAAWLLDARGGHAGGVIYFTDLRHARQADRNLTRLLNTNDLFTGAESETKSLQLWAEMFVHLLNITFCRIFIIDDTREYLVAKAAHPIARAGGLDWSPCLEEPTPIRDWPRMWEFLEGGTPTLLSLSVSGKVGRKLLEEWSARLKLKSKIQSLFVIPLKTEIGLVGLLDLGELRTVGRAAFSEEKKELATAMANQLARVIDLTRLHEETERRRQLLASLSEKSLHLQGSKETSELLVESVRLAAELVGCTAGGLYIFDERLQELVLEVGYKIPAELLNSRLAQDEGLVGLVMRERKPQVSYDYSRHASDGDALKSFNFQTVAAVPLKRAGRIAAVLFVADVSHGRRITQSDLDALERFAAHASMAWHISRLISQEQRMFKQLAALHGISDYIEAAQEVDTILGVLLTGITAGYGLSFNRAAVFLIDELREHLVGRAAIGHLEESEAQKDWQLHHQRGLEDFTEYVKQMEQGYLPPSPLGERIPGLRLPLSPAATDLFSQVIRDKTPRILVTEEEVSGLPRGFVEVFEPSAPAVVIPLMARNQVLGLLIADTKFTQLPILPERLESLMRFVNTGAIAINNASIIKQEQQAKERLQGLLRARNALIPSKKPPAVLQDVVDQIRLAADASWVRLILISETGEKRSRIDKIAGAGKNKVLDFQSSIRPDEISMTVLKTGAPVAVEDTTLRPDLVSPATLKEGSRAFVCLPFAAQERPIGVIWLHYDTPRKFPDTELEALHLYANLAADVYASSGRLEFLEKLRQAADDLAGANSTKKVLRQIVRSAMKVLNADSAVLWYYDSAQDSFILQHSVAAGVPMQVWAELRQTGPRKGGTAYTIMNKGWMPAGHVNDGQHYAPLGETSRALLERLKAQAMQGVALSAGREMLGVLYANYQSPQFFGEEDHSLARAFAYHAALVLKRAKLLDQVKEAKEWVDAGAKVTVLRGRDVALISIAKEAKKRSGCDAVAIFEYDRKRRRLAHPPTMLNVWDEEQASKADEVLRGSLVYTILEMGEPYFAEDVRRDKYFKGRRFAEDEGVKSCIALPLRFAGEANGVMFLNYRSPRRITTEELKNIEVFARQCAVAIQNTQIFEERIKGLSIQESLVDLSRKLLGTVSAEETLGHAVAVAAKELGGVCSILKPDHQGKFTIRAVSGTAEGADTDAGAAGEVGDATHAGARPEVTHGVSVPIHKEGERSGRVIGVLQVQTPAPRHFSVDEVTFLSLVANQTAIALQSAERFEEVERKRAHLEALNEASKAITWSLGSDRRRILNDIVRLAYTCINHIAGHSAILSTIQLYDRHSNKLVFEGVFPFEEYPRVLRGLSERYKLDDKIPLDRSSAPGGRIGITGRAVDEGQTQLINDVWKDPDYIIFDSRTRSELAVPLIEQNRVLGVFNVESDRVGGFDRDDQETLEGLAELAVIAIDNAALYEKEEQRVRLIADMSRIINASLDFNATLKSILRSAKRLIGYTAAEINFWDEDKRGAVVFESDGEPGYAQEAGGFYARDEGFTGRIVRSKQPLLIENTEDYPHIPPKVIDPDKPIRSFVGVPLLLGERLSGTIELVSDTPKKYSDKDGEVLERLGVLAAVAINNAEQAKKMQSAAYAAALAAQSIEIAHRVKEVAGEIHRKLYILRNNYNLPDGAETIVKMIEASAASLIPRKKDYSEAMNPYPLDTSGAELDAVIDAGLSQAEKQWKHLTISKDLNAKALKVSISERGLQRLLQHLLHNSAKAIKSTGGSGNIFVRTTSTESFAFLQVEDDGPGIPAELRSRVLLEPIETEHRVGWGLFMVRLTVERYDGSVRQVEPLSGQGTCFEFRFPISQGSEAGV